jgi:hypothetical protein
MSVHITYGTITVTLQQDAEGYSFPCPLCHNLFFSTGDVEACRLLAQDHLRQFHKILLPSAVITEDNEQPPKVQVQRPA